jgi:AraC-like DNA-binding protein
VRSEHRRTPALAAEAGVSPFELARLFRRHYSTSIGELHRQARVEFACRELRQSERPLADIARDAGFYDQSHFCNVFRRSTGCTPARYRRLARGAPSPGLP